MNLNVMLPPPCFIVWIVLVDCSVGFLPNIAPFAEAQKIKFGLIRPKKQIYKFIQTFFFFPNSKQDFCHSALLCRVSGIRLFSKQLFWSELWLLPDLWPFVCFFSECPPYVVIDFWQHNDCLEHLSALLISFRIISWVLVSAQFLGFFVQTLRCHSVFLCVGFFFICLF